MLKNERVTRLGEIRPYLRPLARLSDRGIPTFLVGDFNSPSHLDEPFPWPVSRALAGAGFRDSYGEADPDPAARPGFTWTAGTPPPRVRKEETVDRIDWVLARGSATTLSSSLVGELGGPDVDTDQRVVRRGERLTIRYASHRGRRIGILPARGSRPIVTLPIYDASDHQAGFFGTNVLRPGATQRACCWTTATACWPAQASASSVRGGGKFRGQNGRAAPERARPPRQL